MIHLDFTYFSVLIFAQYLLKGIIFGKFYAC